MNKSKTNKHEVVDLKNILSEINNLTQVLKESYVFDEEDEFYGEDMTDEIMHDDAPQTNDKINKIRSMALEGIQEFARDVDSEEYDFFKKIWLMCDKVCSDKDKNTNKEV